MIHVGLPVRVTHNDSDVGDVREDVEIRRVENVRLACPQRTRNRAHHAKDAIGEHHAMQIDVARVDDQIGVDDIVARLHIIRLPMRRGPGQFDELDGRMHYRNAGMVRILHVRHARNRAAVAERWRTDGHGNVRHADLYVHVRGREVR